MKSPPTVASFPVSLDMKIPLAESLVFSHVSLLMHTFRSQQVPTAQISRAEQSELESQPRRPPHAIFPSRQKPVPSTALPQIHVLSPSKQELNFPHEDPVQLAVLQTPFWHAPREHWYRFSIIDEDSLRRNILCARIYRNFSHLFGDSHTHFLHQDKRLALAERTSASSESTWDRLFDPRPLYKSL